MSTNDSISVDTVIAHRSQIAAADTPYIDGWSSRRELLEAIDEFVRRDADFKRLEATEASNGESDDSEELQNAKIERADAIESLKSAIVDAGDWLKSVLAPKPTRFFRIFSIETGHDFGTWEAISEKNALAQMAEQAGADVDASTIEVIELTASSFIGKPADFAGRVISPRGDVVESVRAEQDFERGETTFHFTDGTAIVVDDMVRAL